MCQKTLTGLLAVVLMAVVATATLSAQTTLQGRLALRPLTRGDIAAFKLPATTAVSPGLTTVGLGEPLYLEAQVDIAIPAADIAGVTWALSSKPAKSTAIMGDSPLGLEVPIYEPSDRLVSRVAGRALLRPDVVGVYVVTATIAARSGATATIAQTYFAGTYVGITACATCHSGGLAEAKTPTWSKTLHAGIFKDGINGVASDHYAATCLGCHTVGYDANPNAVNGGFDDVANILKWTLPAMAPGNWDAVPDALKNVANIQCENCHGPGSQHASHGGDSIEISVPSNTGACAQCHDAPTHHIKDGEWNNSRHAVATRDASGAGRVACVGCHTGPGFMAAAKGEPVNTAYGAINCQTCHESHGQTTPTTNAHLVRTQASVKLKDGTVVTNAGAGTLCMNCHQSRQNAATYAATTAGTARFGPHHGPQADMLEGVNGFTYGKTIPSSAHSFAAKDTCVTCHMQTVDAADPALANVGGHSFKVSWTPAGKDTKMDLVGACQNCHGPKVTSFDFALLDYDENDVIEGVQTEVQHLLDQLSVMLPPAGKPKDALTIDSTWTQPQLEAAYNWLFVQQDGSRGIHNTAYSVGLLKASIANLEAVKK